MGLVVVVGDVGGSRTEANRRAMFLLCSCQLLSNSIADPGLPDLFLFFQMKPEIHISLWISQLVAVTTNSN